MGTYTCTFSTHHCNSHSLQRAEEAVRVDHHQHHGGA